MAEATLPLFEWARNREDFTDACCWAIWNAKAGAYDNRPALVDVEDFERLKDFGWRIQKVGKCRTPRIVRDGTIYLAREIMGSPKGMAVDHRDRNTLNDRRRNLRVCTTGENNLNKAQNGSARSRFRGVAWLPTMQVWQVYPGKRGQRVLVGRFACEVEAARAYNE